MSFAALVCACSTTRTLSEGEYRYRDTKIVVDNETDKKLNPNDLKNYLKQSPNTYYIGHWNPFLYVYNWSHGNGSKWDRFVERIGQAPVVFDSTLVQPSIDGMLNHLEYLGYYNSKITESHIIKDRNITPEYKVHLGKRYPLRKIDFNVKDPELAAIMASDSANFTIAPGDYLSEEALEAESERLAGLFRNHGYWGFTKNYFFFFADTTNVKDGANMWAEIEDYTRNETPAAARPHRKYTIGSVNIIPQGNLKVRNKVLQRLNRIKIGDLYNETEIKNTYNRFSSVPVFSTVNVNLSERDSTELDCRIMLSPAKLQGIKFNIEGSFNAAGLFGVAPSISYSHKNLFHGGEVFTLGLKGNFQFRFKDPTRALELAANAGLTLPRSVLLPDKWFKKNPPKTDIKLNFNYSNRPEYRRNMFGASFGYTWYSADQKRRYQIYPIKVNLVKVHDISEEFIEKILDPTLLNSYMDHLDFGLKGNFYFSTSELARPKSNYFYVRATVETSGNLLSAFNKFMKYDPEFDERQIFGVPYSQYARAEVAAVPTVFFGDENKWSFAARFLLGLGIPYGNSLNLPLEQVFHGGGASSLRGWQARTVGPGSAPKYDAFKIPNQYGSMHAEVNLELRFPIVWKFYGGLFVDAGNVWSTKFDLGFYDGSQFTFRDCFRTSALNWGLGLRLDFDLLLVRLDYGMQSYDPRSESWVTPRQWFKEKKSALHFGIGLPF